MDPAPTQAGWFELFEEGWALQASARPLAALLYEAIQNAFDQPEVRRVSVALQSDALVVEDDGATGFTQPELAYKLFFTNKGASPHLRGRHGRGLKELLSAMSGATIETVGFTLHFGAQGRQLAPSRRKQGTRLLLQRHTSDAELQQTEQRLRMLIPPDGIAVDINGRKVKRPRAFATLRGASLPTVSAENGVERIVRQPTEVALYEPRTGEVPHVFEMGLPVERSAAPWHVDVGQRIPLGERRDRLEADYRRRLWCLLFESLVAKELTPEHLTGDWVNEALASGKVRREAVEAYVRRVFPSPAVLGSTRLDDDRAQQAGAHVIDVSGLSRGMRETLAQVLRTSDQFNLEREHAAQKVLAASPYEQRTVSFLKHLAKLILERPVSITLVRQPDTVDGTVVSATFDRKRFEMRINVGGKMDLRRPLEPQTLGIFFHELAHAFTAEHDHVFIQHLELVAGRGAHILAQRGAELAARYGVPFE